MRPAAPALVHAPLYSMRSARFASSSRETSVLYNKSCVNCYPYTVHFAMQHACLYAVCALRLGDATPSRPASTHAKAMNCMRLSVPDPHLVGELAAPWR